MNSTIVARSLKGSRKTEKRDGRKQESRNPEPRDAFVTRGVAVQGD